MIIVIITVAAIAGAVGFCLGVGFALAYRDEATHR